MMKSWNWHFNSRPHEEVDHDFLQRFPITGISTHDLTKRSTGAALPVRRRQGHFNSRPHEEVDTYKISSSAKTLYFNSRPHEEVDPWYLFHCFAQVISTHDLTKRSTRIAFSFLPFASDFNSRPHEEVDPFRPFICLRNCHFNSRPHEEVDGLWLIYWLFWLIFQLTTSRRGRLRKWSILQCPGKFQLTTSRRGRLYQQSSVKARKSFQLTTSRRGRRPSDSLYATSRDFNSRPHEEVDSIFCHVIFLQIKFQLTTSRRGRRSGSYSIGDKREISTHDLTKRSTGFVCNVFHIEVISTHDLTKRSTPFG